MDSTTAKVIVTPVEVEPCVVKLQIEMPAERAEKIYAQVETMVAKQATLPGFRQGKLPRNLLLKHHGKRIIAEATDRILRESCNEALDESDYSNKIAGEAKLSEEDEFKEYIPGQPFKYEVIINVRPSFELPNYKGLQLSREVKKVTDADVEQQIDKTLDMCISYDKTEGPAAQRDILTLDYSATLPEGVTVPENANYLVKAEKTWVALREPEMLPGVSTLLLGVKPEDERDADVTFPETFEVEELRNKTISYHFKIHEIRSEVRPELNEEFTQRFGCETVDVFRETMRKRLEAQSESIMRSSLIKQISDILFMDLSFPLPPAVVKSSALSILRSEIEKEKRAGTDVEAIRAKEAELTEKAQAEAEKSLRQFYLLSEIVNAENIEFTEEDNKQMLYSFAMEGGKKDLNAIIKEKRESGEITQYVNNVLFGRAFDKIIEMADVVDIAPKED